MHKIHEWNDIKSKYNNCILLGNGASIAVSELFKYESLYKKAKEEKIIDEKLANIFKRFYTNDFETILHKLLQAEAINQTLSIDSKPITNAYLNCKNSLIKIIQKIHPNYENIGIENLDNIASFLKQFKIVFTLNYDLILYWAMYRGNLPKHDGEKILENGSIFKDCFIEKSNGDKCFKSDWDFLTEPCSTRKSATLVFYLHGNLTLANHIKNNIYELSVKITSLDADHLDTIFQKWNTGHYSPIFICEGESKRKFDSIKSNSYLSTVYYDVLNQHYLGDSIAFYGFNFGDQDEHIIARFADVSRKNPIRNIAVSVFKNGEEVNYMDRVNKIINNKIGRNIIVEFYDSTSSACWNNTM